MKQFKLDIIRAAEAETKHSRVVMLKDIAQNLGYNHISNDDCYDIARSLKSVQGYKLVRILYHEYDSLFQSLALVSEECFTKEDERMKEHFINEIEGSISTAYKYGVRDLLLIAWGQIALAYNLGVINVSEYMKYKERLGFPTFPVD